MFGKLIQAARKGISALKEATNKKAKQSSVASTQGKEKPAHRKTTKETEQARSDTKAGTKQEQLEKAMNQHPETAKELRNSAAAGKGKDVGPDSSPSPDPTPNDNSTTTYTPNRQRSLSLDDKGGPAL